MNHFAATPFLATEHRREAMIAARDQRLARSARATRKAHRAEAKAARAARPFEASTQPAVARPAHS
jgi:hypothetical protein